MTENTTSTTGIVAIYARTSTDEQEDGLESQLDSCRDKFDEEDLQNSKLYKDDGISGAKDSRPAFNRLQRDLANGDIKKVVQDFMFRRTAGPSAYSAVLLKIPPIHLIVEN